MSYREILRFAEVYQKRSFRYEVLADSDRILVEIRGDRGTIEVTVGGNTSSGTLTFERDAMLRLDGVDHVGWVYLIDDWEEEGEQSFVFLTFQPVSKSLPVIARIVFTTGQGSDNDFQENGFGFDAERTDLRSN